MDSFKVETNITCMGLVTPTEKLEIAGNISGCCLYSEAVSVISKSSRIAH